MVLAVYMAMSTFWLLVNILREASIMVDSFVVAVTLVNICLDEQNLNYNGESRLLPFA